MADQVILIGSTPVKVTDNGDGTFSAHSIDNDAGVKATDVTMPAGGVGKIGWLSGIYDRLSKVVLTTGSAIIGKVGIDQTTPGTTNGVQINAALPAGDNHIGEVNILTMPGVTLGALSAGTNIIGKVGVDQTTDGTTNRVVAKISQTTGENVVSFNSVSQPVTITGGSLATTPGTPFIATATSAPNAVAVATVAAVAAKQHYCIGYIAVIRAAAAGNDILVTIKDGATTKLTDVIGISAPSGTSAEKASGYPVVIGTANTALTLNIAAGGAGVIAELTVWGYTL